MEGDFLEIFSGFLWLFFKLTPSKSFVGTISSIGTALIFLRQSVKASFFVSPHRKMFPLIP